MNCSGWIFLIEIDNFSSEKVCYRLGSNPGFDKILAVFNDKLRSRSAFTALTYLWRDMRNKPEEVI